jgi:hypothetical protein
MIKLVHGDGTICERPGHLHFELGKAPEALVCGEVEFAVARHGDGPPYLVWRRRPEPPQEILMPFGDGMQIISQPFDAGKWQALLAVQTAEERLAAVSNYIQARFASPLRTPPPTREEWIEPVDEFRRERLGTWPADDPEAWRSTVMNQEPPVPGPLRFECAHQASNFRPCPKGCHAHG